MRKGKVFVVMLRRPRKNDPRDMRSDPFWEFGSFGVTGCHSKNLLHPKNIKNLENNRLAFFQGSKESIKLLLITPTVKIEEYSCGCEVLWKNIRLPFCFGSAPIVINNSGYTDFPKIKEMISVINRNTWMGRVASAFRSRKKELSDDVAEELLNNYFKFVDLLPVSNDYLRILPYRPGCVDKERRKTYELFKARLKQ